MTASTRVQRDVTNEAHGPFALLPPPPPRLRFTYAICVMSTEQKLNEAMSNLSTEDVAARAAELKAAGNKLFTEKKYDEAIKVYGDAIAVQETAILYCNRAASHLAIQS